MKALPIIVFLSFVLVTLALTFLYQYFSPEKTKYSMDNSSIKLPLVRPADLSIQVDERAGMLPQGKTIYLSKAESYLDKWDGRLHIKPNFEITDKELDDIYAFILKNGFSDIQQIRNEGIVYDAGTHSIALVYDNGTKEVFKEWHPMVKTNEEGVQKYKAVLDLLENISKDKLENKKITAQITLHPSLIAGAAKTVLAVSPQIENKQFDSQKEATNVWNIKVFEGEYQLHISTFDKENKIIVAEQYPISLTNTTKEYSIEQENNHIKIIQNKGQ